LAIVFNLFYLTKILHIATNISGGAGVVNILNKNLRENGLDSKILCLIPNKEPDPNTFSCEHNPANIMDRFLRKVGIFTRNDYKAHDKLLGKKEFNYPFSFPQSDYDLAIHPLVKEADIIHFHWISGFLDFNFFSKVNKPFVWTLHDMHPFTGGCHHSQGCNGYKTNCADCPQLMGTKSTDYARQNVDYKQKHMYKLNMHIVALNTYMYSCSSSSILFGNYPHQIIPNSVDTDLFLSQSKEVSRKMFEMNSEKKILGFSSSYYARGKGADLLGKAMQILNPEFPDIELCYIGREYPELNAENIKYKGRINDPSQLSHYYSAIDAMVIPSREDNLPSVMLESFACGRPVISYKVGGLADHVIEEKTGCFAAEVTAEALAFAIKKFISTSEKYKEQDIRKYAEQEFSVKIQTERYAKLYKEIAGS